MAKSALSIEQLRNLARRGAAAAIAELERQIEAIRKAFPDVGRKAVKHSRGRKRSRMSAAARKAVSARMKKYWAARRAGAKK